MKQLDIQHYHPLVHNIFLINTFKAYVFYYVVLKDKTEEEKSFIIKPVAEINVMFLDANELEVLPRILDYLKLLEDGYDEFYDEYLNALSPLGIHIPDDIWIED